MEKKWWKEAVVYQIYPRSFMDSNGDGIGDLQGIIQKLDYLKDLGVTVIWLCPVYKSPMDDNGYDISDYYDIEPQYGTMEDWEQLLAEAHGRGMKLIMDLVVNHCSDQHMWFQEACKSKDNPYRDYFIWKDGKNGGPPNNWASFFSTGAWEYHQPTGQYYLHSFSKRQPDFNWENENFRKDIYKMLAFWLDKGIDGFRLDVCNLLAKHTAFLDVNGRSRVAYEYIANQPKVHDYFREIQGKVLSRYDSMTVGEMPGVDAETALLYVDENRRELNMVFQFEHMEIDGGSHSYRPMNYLKLKTILSHWQNTLMNRGWNALYLNNHDQPRLVSRFGDEKKYRRESATLFATMLHTLQGTPYLYQGEEIGMTDTRFKTIEEYRDVATINAYYEARKKRIPKFIIKMVMNKKSRDNGRTPMHWDSSANAGFTSGTPWIGLNPNYTRINIQDSQNDKNSILRFYKEIINLRKNNPVQIYGDFKEYYNSNPKIYCYSRSFEGKTLFILLNFTKRYVQVKTPAAIMAIAAFGSVYISNYGKTGKLALKTRLGPYEALVFLFTEKEKN